MYQDEVLVCKDCGAEYVFSAREQEFYAEKGFTNKPVRCKSCRNARKGERGDSRAPREMFDAVCADCGSSTKVPFQPKGDKPVYCSDCFRAHRA